MLYVVVDHLREIDATEYIQKYRDAKRIEGYCQACPNYGKSWGCPPFTFKVEDYLAGYKKVTLIAAQIIFKQRFKMKEIPELILPVRRRLETRLLELEEATGGKAFSYVGSCLYCPEGTCTRLEGKPCRHPDKVRPSLEACGFDISKTTSELFNIELEWGKLGLAPNYLVLVCGFFHNCEHIEWE